MSTLRLAVVVVSLALAARAQHGGGFIDEVIQAAWKSRNVQSAGVKPAPLSTDAQFLRRVYLDLTGRIPTAEEVRTFLANSSPEKRAEAVDRLLESDWFSDRWAQWFADMGRVSHNVQRGYTGRNAYYNWIRNAVRGRMPLSELAAGIDVEEESFMIRVHFDGRPVMAQVTFAPVIEGLWGPNCWSSIVWRSTFPRPRFV